MKKHILFTARDIGAAHHIKHIARAFDKKGYRTSIIASGVAYDVFKKEGLKPRLFSINGKKSFIPHKASQDLINELLDSSYREISRKKPDAVFCGLASADYGIDEATLYWASRERLNIPSFHFLDTRGTFNHLKGGYPDIYFVIDKVAQKYSYKSAKAPVRVVGSPKHENYASKPVDEWRKNIRKKFDIGKNTRLIGYFGQDPNMPGYIQNFEELVKAIKKYNKRHDKKCRLLMRAHPAYKDKYDSYELSLRRNDVDTINAFDEPDTEEILCGCDIVATCFSTVGIDHAYLSHYAKQPIGVTLYLLANKRIRHFLFKNFGYRKNSILAEGMEFCADKPGQVLRKIEYILDNPSSEPRYFKATKSLTDNNNPCEKIIDIVSSFI